MLRLDTSYTTRVPKLWSETIETHRHAVREAILDTAWRLVREHGLTSVTMSQVAKEAGISRGTLYKYFPDVEAILFSAHERHIAAHLEQLRQLGERSGDARSRLKAVLETYAVIAYHRGQGGTELAALLHRGDQVVGAQRRLIELIRDLLTEVAASGQLRPDVSPAELATYCLHSLTAASSLPSEAAVHRLVKVTLAGLTPDSGS